ncbi:MAG TPA: ATP-binding protein [Chondromyces sp.]|nr:ATP-binding protein [Chondromyces sp.]
MGLITRDLLANFLLTLLPMFLIQMLYLFKYTYRIEKSKKWFVAMFPFLSILLCMLYPFALGIGFIWDLRAIPLIVGTLYGGYRLGFLLLLEILVLRFLMGGDGFFVTLYAYPIMTVLASIVSKRYLNGTIKSKVIIGVSLSFTSSILVLSFSEQIYEVSMTESTWIQYFIIVNLGMLVTLLLLEVILTNSNILQKLIKAEKLEVVSHLAASISHEVRNPLTVSRGFMQMLKDDVSADTKKEYVSIAIQELDRASEIINDYLTFAKAVPDKEEEIDVVKLIHHASNVITPLANMNGVEIDVSGTDDTRCIVLGEVKKFEQCMINILKNGIESMKTGGKLQIFIEHRHPYIQIIIQDEGMGMTPEQLSRLGEPYFTTKDKGTGLGMMVSFSIINGMGGKVNVESEYGKGTCFTILLPADLRDQIE